jgi:hypothetical protein
MRGANSEKPVCKNLRYRCATAIHRGSVCKLRMQVLVLIYAAAIDGSSAPKLLVELDSLLAGDPGFSFSPPGNLFFNKSGALCFQIFDPKSQGRPAEIGFKLSSPTLNFFRAFQSLRLLLRVTGTVPQVQSHLN